MKRSLKEGSWETMTHEQKLSHMFPFGHLGVGDRAWAIVGMIAIRVTVEEIQDWRIKGGPYASVEYWVDEPVGHAMCFDASPYGGLCPTKEKAIEVLQKSYREEIVYLAADLKEKVLEIQDANESLAWKANETLESFRKDNIAFIRTTLVGAKSSPEELAEHDEYCRTHYQPKARLEEWFNVSDILMGSV